MDGQGRCFDNIFVERLWRTVKYEEVYVQEYLDERASREKFRKLFLLLQSRATSSKFRVCLNLEGEN